jgi:hypothetical protein
MQSVKAMGGGRDLRTWSSTMRMYWNTDSDDLQSGALLSISHFICSHLIPVQLHKLSSVDEQT